MCNVTQSIFPVVGAQMSPPEVNTVVTMQDNPSYSTVEGGPTIKPNHAYMKTNSEWNIPFINHPVSITLLLPIYAVVIAY